MGICNIHMTMLSITTMKLVKGALHAGSVDQIPSFRNKGEPGAKRIAPDQSSGDRP
jgi:hypothetical protein